MDSQELRALALETVASSYRNEHRDTEQMLIESAKVAEWLIYGSLPTSQEEAERAQIGKTMREMAQREHPDVRSLSAESLIENQPGEIVDPPQVWPLTDAPCVIPEQVD